MLFEQLFHDEHIRQRYALVTDYEDRTGGWAYHGWDHVTQVTAMTASILEQLNMSKEYIHAAKIAALLHDIGADEGKEGHAQRSMEFAQKLLASYPPVPYEQELYQAIRNHSNGFDTDELMTVALILSDKLDITRPRVAKAGYSVQGMRQLQYLTAIDLQISPAKVTVSFRAEPDLNLTELNHFYFTEKVFRAVSAFATLIQRTPELILNGEVWQLPA